MNNDNDIKKMIGVMAILGIATILLLIILMMGYNYIIVKIFAGICMLLFLLSGIALVKLKTEE